MLRALTWAIAILCVALIAGVAIWHFSPDVVKTVAHVESDDPEDPEDVWLEHLFSHNPADAHAAEKWVVELGEDALPMIEETLRSRDEDRERRKAALKACGLLGTTAAPLMKDVATYLLQADLTAQAAAALSFMGKDALPPLVDGIASTDATVRRESLRAIGKLHARGPLDADVVIPLLIGGTSDSDAGVRAIASTYLGIIHERPHESIPAVTALLDDPDASVRLAAANALAEFGPVADLATAALRKAAGDKDPEVAREAGRALVMVSSVR